VGYQSRKGKPDGKFRHIEVKVHRPGASVRARNGYYAPNGDKPGTSSGVDEPVTSVDTALVGWQANPGLGLRLNVVPIAMSAAPAATTRVALVLGVREPTPRGRVDEELTLYTSATKDSGTPKPEPHTVHFTVEPGPSEDTRYEIASRINLAPGHYEIRVNAHSRAL